MGCAALRLKLLIIALLISCRAHKEDEGECEASECNLLCEDMLRAGFSRFIVDPGVRQAYYPDTARQLYTKKVCRACTLHRKYEFISLPRGSSRPGCLGVWILWRGVLLFQWTIA